ncbi:hypothetical protein [Meridianimarinicoccus aquatilis]|uniref:Uncharacterized protein n=1 Tax=Meridianimarinicoccus aquatilis TaxID=2552766 RepID=A0A4R6B546_9RHOB|nr:hypothetical protein [Fluviibacterium aquatile]TDL91008.1 hypothetical protein E2L05_03140 [Fluviibacterium aquatile]
MSDTHLEATISRFRAFADVIAELYRDDPNVRSVCQEKEVADVARSRWEDMPDRAKEYGQVLECLENEFLDTVSKGIGSGPPQSAPNALHNLKE